MSMVSMFSRLNALEKEMEMEVVGQDVDTLNTLDEEHTEVWRNILAYEPHTSEITELMVLLLLERLERTASRNENCIEVREKIVSLFQSSQAGYIGPCVTPDQFSLVQRAL